jgi:hypothetical protein
MIVSISRMNSAVLPIDMISTIIEVKCWERSDTPLCERSDTPLKFCEQSDTTIASSLS